MVSSVVEAVFCHAQTQPDKLCLADEGRNVTYLQYRSEIQKLAGSFSGQGVGVGDAVVVEAQQTITYLAIELALQLIGAVFVPVERNCTADKMEATAECCDAVAIIAAKPMETARIFYTYEELIAIAAKTAALEINSFPNRDVVSEILFSTGTTGKEKGIVLTHGNDIALAENVMYGVEMQEDNVEMIPSPLNHSHGLRRYYGNMVRGATVVLATGVLNVRSLFDSMDKYGVNAMDLVPTALSVLLKLSKGKLAEYADVLRYVQLGAAPLMQADKERIRDMLPNTRLYNFYGSTESGCICIYDFNRPNEKPNCIGKPTRNAHIMITDSSQREITSSARETGLLASRGSMNMLGYWKDPEETARAMQDGCVFSNDEAYFDEDGDIILLGRKGDVINVGGLKVAPTEVEAAALEYEPIEDCICIGVEDPLTGKAVKLLVVLREGMEFSPKSIRSFLAAKLENYKVPLQYEVVNKIARTYNGKLDRKFYA